MLVLSPNKTYFNVFETLHMSFMYRINNFGPSTDPWGTPQSNVQAWWDRLSQLHSLLPVTYIASNPIQNYAPDTIPLHFIDQIVMIYGVNAFLRSRNIPTAYFFWSIEVVISAIVSVNASDVDLFDLNPYWLSFSNLCLFLNFSNLLLSFSRIFENCGSRETVIGEVVSVPRFVQWCYCSYFHKLQM